MKAVTIKGMKEKAQEIADFMKCFSNATRMLILCQLVDGEKSVGEIIAATGVPQTSMSQHLNKLKAENVVSFRREHRNLYYSISDEKAYAVMETLYNLFCKNK